MWDSVGAGISPLYVVDEALADNTVATGGGIVAAEIPVSLMVGEGGMEVVECLEDDADVSPNRDRCQQGADFCAEFIFCERCIDALDNILDLLPRQGQHSAGFLIDFFDHPRHAALGEQCDGGLEGNEVAKFCHIDAVAIGVADLGGGADDDDFSRPQAVECADDALAQGCAADDAVVNDDEVVCSGGHGAVGNVIDVGDNVVTTIILADEGSHLGVFDRDFLNPWLEANDLGELVCIRVVTKCLDLFDFESVEVVLDPLVKPEEATFCGVWDKAEDGVCEVMVDGIEDLRDEECAELLALAVDVAVTAPAEVNAFEAARAFGAGFDDLLDVGCAAPLDDHSGSRGQFLDLLEWDIEGSLDLGPLRGQDDDFFIFKVECWSDAVGVAQDEGIAMADHASDDVTAIPLFGGVF